MANGGYDGCEEKELGWRPRSKVLNIISPHHPHLTAENDPLPYKPDGTSNTRQLNSLIPLRPFFSSQLQDDRARLCDFAHHRTAIWVW
ncbi:hypothetical protein BYT27DRAFT_7199393 [Phlegmacium glaucopus]|nr:hypothetical protein BYT27DRAFT_7199393 [Phlegmacium glaucopus]